MTAGSAQPNESGEPNESGQPNGSGQPAGSGQANGPRRRRPISLRSRVTLLAAIAVGLSAAVISGAAFLVVQQALYSDLDARLLQRGYEVVEDPVLRQLPGATLFASDLRVALVGPSGVVAQLEGVPAPPVGSAERVVAAGQVSQSLRTVDNQRVLAVPAGPNVALVLAESLNSVRQTLASLGVVLLLVGGAGVVLAAVAGAAVARAGLAPVQRLTEATERVASTGELSPIPVSGDDELARLSMSFNRMLGAVALAQDQQRRLVADAGHELRTPLTSLRTNIELLDAANRPGAPALPGGDREEILTDVRAQIEELSTLVGDLVELARDDTPAAVHQEIELVEVIERALQRARRRAGDVQFQSWLAPWTVTGDATALERAVLNLLDNAAKWSPPDGVVRVQLRQLGDGHGLLEVADAGPGIADADLPRVFDRFYRSAAERTMPGSGLGLSIVRQVAERHGGSVWAGRSLEGGALLAVRLPGR